MVSLPTKRTGIHNTLFASTKGYASERLGPRIKIAVDPPTRLIAAGKAAFMLLGNFYVGGYPIPADIAEQVRRFIELNRDALTAYWNGDVDTGDFLERVRPIGDDNP